MIEVQITDKVTLEMAMKKLKGMLIKEGIFKELKQRRFFEKPSVKKKRKQKEAARRRRKEGFKKRRR